MKLIGVKVICYRKLKSWTQLELATESGLSEDYISMIENGRATGLTVITAMRIANALGCNIEDLINDEAKMD